MIAYKTEKLNNAICYFANEVYKRRKEYLPQTLLHKLLSYLDFTSIEKLGVPALELKYRALKNGPVPEEIYRNKDVYETDCFKFEKRSNGRFIIISKREADLDYFSEFEIEIMENLLNKYITKNTNMKAIIDNICNDSHNEIKAWRKAFSRKQNRIMNYSNTFESIDKKNHDDLSINEERFLVYSGLKEKASCN